MPSQYKGSKVGFPIRKSLDQSSFAAPQGLSQRTTSFIASQRQGIHRMLLRHLITLMIIVRRSAAPDDHSRKTVFAFAKTIFACQCTRSNGLRAVAGSSALVRPDLTECIPLYDFKHPRRPHDENSAKLCDTGHNKQGVGGARRDRTDDLLNANQALSQLSYGPQGTNTIRKGPKMNGGPGTTRTSDLTLIRGAL